MSEELIIRHCSPTLAGMKTGSLFSCRCASKPELIVQIRGLNHRLVPKGLRVLPLRFWNGRALIYVYRPSGLAKDFTDAQARNLLEKCGYQPEKTDQCILHLIRRLESAQEFPHEVGLFLGYPPGDVCAFIDNKAGNPKCVGCWKVYGDAEAAQKTFDRYQKCTDVYCAQWKQGKSIERLTIAG